MKWLGTLLEKPSLEPRVEIDSRAVPKRILAALSCPPDTIYHVRKSDLWLYDEKRGWYQPWNDEKEKK